MKSRKICAIVVGMILSLVMSVGVMAEQIQMYERLGGTNEENHDVISLSDRTDVMYNGTLAINEDYQDGRLVDEIYLNVQKAGVVSINLCADGFQNVNCDNYLRVSVWNSLWKPLFKNCQAFNLKMPEQWKESECYTFSGGKLYFHYEFYLEQGTYCLDLLSSEERNYQCHITMHSFELSDTMENLSSDDYVTTTYTAKSGELRGCISNNPVGLSYNYVYNNCFNTVIPRDGYYKVSFKGNGVASFSMDCDNDISLSAKPQIESYYSSSALERICIDGINEKWLDYFGGEEKVCYLKAGTYKTRVSGVSYPMIPYNIACYILSVKETTAPVHDSDKITDRVTIDNKVDSSIVNTTKNKSSAVNIRKSKSVPGKVWNLRLKSASLKNVKIGWKKVSSVSGYQIKYSTKKSFKKAVKNKTVKGNKSSATIKKLKNKTYYFKVRAYKMSKGKKVYGAWSETMRVRIVKL